MNTYVIAVSGGVDSVALLDALVRQRPIAREKMPDGEFIVAHFDHGIRTDSVNDAVLVKSLAEKYNVPFVSRREELGADTNEEKARMRRYEFLFSVCREHDATLITAHHADDAVETVAINLTRGTGWRGLAVLDNSAVIRPLVSVTKQEILDYAQQYELTWNEDSTNMSDAYLRNRLRHRLTGTPIEVRMQVMALRSRQVELKHLIDDEAMSLIGRAPYNRYFFSHCGDVVATELLRHVFIAETGMSPATQPRMRALHAVKVMKPGRVIHVADGVSLRFTARDFIVETTL